MPFKEQTWHTIKDAIIASSPPSPKKKKRKLPVHTLNESHIQPNTCFMVFFKNLSYYTSTIIPNIKNSSV